MSIGLGITVVAGMFTAMSLNGTYSLHHYAMVAGGTAALIGAVNVFGVSQMLGLA